MATCAECVHVEVCRFYINSLLEAGAEHMSEDLQQELAERLNGDVCEQFLARDRMAALPCVGDKVYELCRINQFGDYKIDESEIKGFIVDTDGTAFDYELLGKRFFLTPEEAEQALKEREVDESKGAGVSVGGGEAGNRGRAAE